MTLKLWTIDRENFVQDLKAHKKDIHINKHKNPTSYPGAHICKLWLDMDVERQAHVLTLTRHKEPESWKVAERESADRMSRARELEEKS